MEAALAQHEGVSEAAAFVIPDEHHTQQIIAVVTLTVNSNLSPDELSSYVRKVLPTYAVPRNISIKEHLPHTSSGKIDRRQLAQEHSSAD